MGDKLAICNVNSNIIVMFVYRMRTFVAETTLSCSVTSKFEIQQFTMDAIVNLMLKAIDNAVNLFVNSHLSANMFIQLSAYQKTMHRTL